MSHVCLCLIIIIDSFIIIIFWPYYIYFFMKLTAINSIKAEDCSTLDGRQEGALHFFLFLSNFNVTGWNKNGINLNAATISLPRQILKTNKLIILIIVIIHNDIILNSLPGFEGVLSSCSTKVSCTPNLILCFSIYCNSLIINPSNFVNNNNFLSGYNFSKSISI